MRLVMLALGITVSLTAQVAPVQAHGRIAVPVVTDAQVEHWLKIWQKRLSLQDWMISAKIVRSSELKPDTMGNLRWNSATRSATIRVMHPLDYDLPLSEVPADVEFTIVHELIHLQLSVLPRNVSRELEENVVNKLGEALFALEKGAAYRPRAVVAHLAIKDKAASEASRSAK